MRYDSESRVKASGAILQYRARSSKKPYALKARVNGIPDAEERICVIVEHAMFTKARGG